MLPWYCPLRPLDSRGNALAEVQACQGAEPRSSGVTYFMILNVNTHWQNSVTVRNNSLALALLARLFKWGGGKARAGADRPSDSKWWFSTETPIVYSNKVSIHLGPGGDLGFWLGGSSSTPQSPTLATSTTATLRPATWCNKSMP